MHTEGPVQGVWLGTAHCNLPFSRPDATKHRREEKPGARGGEQPETGGWVSVSRNVQPPPGGGFCV
jgi:hypothetical protein